MKHIPSFRLRMEPLDKAAETMPKFEYAPNEVGERHKIGGKPDFIQQEIVPTCPDCRSPMTFFAQLDSLNDEFNIADCGMIYVFICFGCNETRSIIQSN